MFFYFMKIINLFEKLIENPFGIKNYKDICDYYLSVGDKSNYDIFKAVILEKYVDDSDFDKKQQNNN